MRQGLAGENSGEIKVFEPGSDLFKQGDAGGDLFFIREGEVDVFLEQEGQLPINLAVLVPGEVLGLLTCLNRSPRTASARAKGTVAAFIVKYEQFQSLLGRCPEWLKVILKELTLRVKQMNDKYAQALMVIRKLKLTQVNALYTGSQVAAALPILGGLCAVNVEGKQFILLDEVLDLMEQALTRPRLEIDAILGVFTKSGLIKLEAEPEKKRRVIAMDVAKKAPPFSTFVVGTKAGKGRKIVAAKLAHKDYRNLRGLLKFAKAKNIELKGLIKLPLGDLRTGFAEATSMPYDELVLQRGVKLGILDIQGDWTGGTILFAPSDMNRTLVFAETFGLLEAMDTIVEPGKVPEPKIKAAS